MELLCIRLQWVENSLIFKYCFLGFLRGDTANHKSDFSFFVEIHFWQNVLLFHNHCSSQSKSTIQIFSDKFLYFAYIPSGT